MSYLIGVRAHCLEVDDVFLFGHGCFWALWHVYPPVMVVRSFVILSFRFCILADA